MTGKIPEHRTMVFLETRLSCISARNLKRIFKQYQENSIVCVCVCVIFNT